MTASLKRTLIIADEQDITEKGIAESFRKNYLLHTKISDVNEFLQKLKDFPNAIAIVSTALNGFNIVKVSQQIEQNHQNGSVILASPTYCHIYANFVQQGIYKGYFTKNITLKELLSGVHAVDNGSQFNSSAVHPCFKLKKDNIVLSYSGPKLEVFIHLTASRSPIEIAELINLSRDSVYKMRTSILNETNCLDESALIIYAMKNKLCTQEMIDRLNNVAT